MSLKSIEQARAAFAWECAKGKDKQYGSQVNKVPAYIKTNGLLNMMAFFYPKSGDEKEEILNDICRWLVGENNCNDYPLISEDELSNRENLKESVLTYLLDIQKSDARFLIQCTSEVLALMNWLRRFANAD